MSELRQHLKGDTGRLAATYLAIIMGLTIVFSAVIFAVSARQFDRPLPPRSQSGYGQYDDDFSGTAVQQLFHERAEQARTELMLSLIMLNLVVLLGGAFFSYFLARKTLEPIEAAMRSQQQFVSDASHELRTPLTALQVTNEVALRKKKLTLAQAKDLIGHNLAETIKLNALSEALLGLARQDGADVSKRPISLAETVHGAIQTLEPLAVEKKVAITHDIPSGDVTANEAAVGQIIRILLDNAIKYSPEKSTVAVSAEMSSNGTAISVVDHGPGIAPEHHGRIFDRFYRVDESRSTQHVEGNGLGLAIARAIADRHGYKLEVASDGMKGSTFTLLIPEGQN